MSSKKVSNLRAALYFLSFIAAIFVTAILLGEISSFIGSLLEKIDNKLIFILIVVLIFILGSFIAAIGKIAETISPAKALSDWFSTKKTKENKEEDITD